MSSNPYTDMLIMLSVIKLIFFCNNPQDVKLSLNILHSAE